jgi:subtilisin family serine protease
VTATFTSAVLGFAADLTADEIQALRQNPAVAGVEPDTPVYAFADCRTRFAAPCSQTLPLAFPWGLDRIDQGTGRSNTFFAQRRGAGVAVLVIDSGLRNTHVEFIGRRPSRWWFWPSYGSYADATGHGTHVTGTIAGRQYGIAKDAEIVPFRVFGSNDTTTTAIIISALDAIHRDAANLRPAVVNMSLGGPPSGAKTAAVRRVIAAGIPVVAAAGNETQNACNVSPAHIPEVITVAASNEQNGRASFSNFGPCVDLYAPGTNIVSASYTNDNGTRILQGTSMAAPHVTGVIATYLGSEITGPNPPANASSSGAQMAQAVTSGAWQGVLRGNLNGSPNRLLSSRWGPLAASTCRVDSLSPALPSRVVELTGYDCQAGPDGAGRYAMAVRIAGYLNEEVSVQTSWLRSFAGATAVTSPAGDVITRSTGNEIRFLPAQNGVYTLWVTSALPWATGDVSLFLRQAPPPGVVITGTASPTRAFERRDPIVFTWKIQNQSGRDLILYTTEMRQAPSDAVIVGSATSSQGSCSVVGIDRVTCQFDHIAPGESVDVRVEASALSAGPATATMGDGRVNFDVLPKIEVATIFEPATTGVVSTDFEAAANAKDSEAAFDFRVPYGVDAAEPLVMVADGEVPSGKPAVATGDLRIYREVAGSPDSTGPVCQFLDAPNTSELIGNLAFENIDTCRLSGGRYWLSAQANYASTDGQWTWLLSRTASGQADLWRNPGGALSARCRAWSGIPTCGSAVESNLAMRLEVGLQVPIGTATQVNEVAKGNQAPIGLARDTQGRFVVGFIDAEQLRVRRYDRLGGVSGASVLVAPASRIAHLDGDGAGNVLLAFDTVNPADPEISGPSAVRSLSAAGALSAPVPMLETPRPGILPAAVACNNGGACLVSWLEYDFSAGIFHALARPFTSLGVATGPAREIAAATSSLGALRLADVDADTFVAVWTSTDRVWASTIDTQGNQQGAPFEVSPPLQAGVSHHVPAVVGDGQGGFVVAWYRSLSPSSAGRPAILVQAIDASGRPCAEPIEATSLASGEQIPRDIDAPEVALVESDPRAPGRWTVGFGVDNTPDSEHLLFGRSGLGCTADPWPWLVSDGPGAYRRLGLQMAGSPYGGVLSAWAGSDEDGDELGTFVRVTSSITTLQRNQPIQGGFAESPELGHWLHMRRNEPYSRWTVYRLNVPAGVASFTVDLDQIDGGPAPTNLDLRVRKGALPDALNADCRPGKPLATAERCAIASNTQGVWWIAVSVEAGEGARYRLRANW